MIGYTPLEADIRMAREHRSERKKYTAGLRMLADRLDAHPEIPLPYDGSSDDGLSIHFLYGFEDPRAALAAAARALGCAWRKDVRGDEKYGHYFDLLGELDGLKVKLTAYRGEVCERVVTGTREVTKKVKDPEALAAVPEVEVTETVEDVEWVCGSVLSPAARRSGSEKDEVAA